MIEFGEVKMNLFILLIYPVGIIIARSITNHFNPDANIRISRGIHQRFNQLQESLTLAVDGSHSFQCFILEYHFKNSI